MPADPVVHAVIWRFACDECGPWFTRAGLTADSIHADSLLHPTHVWCWRPKENR